MGALYAFGHFDEGMTGGWTEEQFGDDDFFLELMGAEGNDLVRETMDPLYDFIDRHLKNPCSSGLVPHCHTRPSMHPTAFENFTKINRYQNQPSAITATSPGGMRAWVT